MRTVYAMAVLLSLACGLIAGPPSLKIPPEVKSSGETVSFQPETDAVSVIYVGLNGYEPIPSELLKDPRYFLFLTRGIKEGRYDFIAVAASATGEQTKARFTVIVGTGVVPIKDPPKDPPPIDKDPPKAATYYFAVVRSDGPASPEFSKIMEDDAWKEFTKKGHTVKDFTLSDMNKTGYNLPAGTVLPCVVTLVEKDGKSTVKRPPVPLPSGSGIPKLLEGL